MRIDKNDPHVITRKLLEDDLQCANKIFMEKCKQKQREVDIPYMKPGNLVQIHRNKDVKLTSCNLYIKIMFKFHSYLKFLG